MITTDHVFHNGLTKSSDKNPRKTFGKTKPMDGEEYAVELVDDLAKVPPARLNKPSLAWQKAIATLAPSDDRRLE